MEKYHFIFFQAQKTIFLYDFILIFKFDQQIYVVSARLRACTLGRDHLSLNRTVYVLVYCLSYL